MKQYTKEEILSKSFYKLRSEIKENINCNFCKHSYSCLECYDCNYCAECNHCDHCLKCARCNNCVKCYHLTDCLECYKCNHCYFSQGLNGKEYVVCNVQLTRDEYERWIEQ